MGTGRTPTLEARLGCISRGCGEAVELLRTCTNTTPEVTPQRRDRDREKRLLVRGLGEGVCAFIADDLWLCIYI